MIHCCILFDFFMCELYCDAQVHVHQANLSSKQLVSFYQATNPHIWEDFRFEETGVFFILSELSLLLNLITWFQYHRQVFLCTLQKISHIRYYRLHGVSINHSSCH